MQCQTVRVVSPVSDENPHGFIVINATDLTEEHELFVEPAAEVEVEPAAAAAPKKGAK